MTEFIDVPAGLAGVAVAETEVGDVVGDRGYYHYRGRSAPDLARTSSFEQVAGLVLTGSSEALELDRSLPPGVVDLIPKLDLRSAISAVGTALDLQPLHDMDDRQRRADATRLIGAMPTVVASVIHGRRIEPDPELGHAADYLRMVAGKPPSPEQVAALEAFLILTIDHGFNNSTFASRVVASAGSDLAACVLAGYGSLSGPRHGANVERMLDMFDAIGEPENAEEWMKAEMAARRRLQGFGHSVYRARDPRLSLLQEHGVIIAPERHRVAIAAEEAGTRLLAGRRLVPNVDLYSPVVLEGCGIPRGWFTATFAVSRLTGWCAHAIEQASDMKIFRPASRYFGPPPDQDVY